MEDSIQYKYIEDGYNDSDNFHSVMDVWPLQYIIYAGLFLYLILDEN